MSKWWKHGSKIPLGDKNFQTILTFFLFECPVVIEQTNKNEIIKKHVSARGISLEQRGWSGKNLVTLMAAMKRTATPALKYMTVAAKDDVAFVVSNEEKATSLADPHFEIVAFKENTAIGKTKSVFYMIRNGFAHGSFSVETTDVGRIYCFESEKDGDIKGQFRLREESLLAWIKLVDTPVNELKRKTKKARTAV